MLDDPLNTAPCGFLSFDDEGVVRRANRTLLELLDREGSDVYGQPFERLLTLPNRIFYQTHFLPLLQLHGRAEEIFLTLRTRTGDGLPVLVNAVRKETPEGAATDCILLPVRRRVKYEDEILKAKREAERALQTNDALVAAQEELESRTWELDRKIRRLEQKNDDLTRLNRILSHDLKEPVRKIEIFTDLLLEAHRDRLTEAGHTSVDKILESCVRIKKLLRTLQQYTALDADDERLTCVDLDDVFEWALHQAQAESAVPASVECASLPAVEGYESQLRALFFNLLDNALKFGKPGEPVRLSVESTVVQSNSYTALQEKYRYVDFARITFTDDGVGFDPRYSSYVFGMLTKLDVETSGLGYGLAICKKVVDNHYGSISVESDRGRGTSVTVLLPLEQ